MVSVDDVGKLAEGLPEVAVVDHHRDPRRTVGGKVFAWVRAFSKADIKRFGSDPVPPGPILAVRTDDVQDKQAVLEADLPGFFTIPHFDGYPAVLIQLGAARLDDVRAALEDGWLAMAPAPLARQYLAGGDAN